LYIIASLLNLSSRLLGIFMLPDPKHDPPGLSKRAVHALIAGNVALKLWRPIGAVDPGDIAVIRAAVPEAPIDEDGDPTLGEDDVWSNSDPVCLKEKVGTKPEAACMQLGPELHLGAGVAATVGAHHRSGCRARRMWVVNHRGIIAPLHVGVGGLQ
jgi:hypothetical protein